MFLQGVIFIYRPTSSIINNRIVEKKNHVANCMCLLTHSSRWLSFLCFKEKIVWLKEWLSGSLVNLFDEVQCLRLVARAFEYFVSFGESFPSSFLYNKLPQPDLMTKLSSGEPAINIFLLNCRLVWLFSHLNSQSVSSSCQHCPVDVSFDGFSRLIRVTVKCRVEYGIFGFRFGIPGFV